MLLTALCAAVFVSPAPAQGGSPLRLHVDASLASGVGDGSSWSDAFQGELGLRDALAALPPGVAAEVWVADGTYFPGLPSDGPAAHFALRDDVAIFGGFDGGEATLDERDPAAHPAILSGDLAQDDFEIPISGAFHHYGGTGENARHLVRGIGVGRSARIDGVTLTRGSANGTALGDGDRGACVYLVDASPTIAGCTVRAGDCEAGGILYARGGAPLVVDTSFEENVGNYRGGAAWVEGDVLARFERCTFTNNVGTNGVGLFVGSISFEPGPTPLRAEVADCRFEGNRGEISSPAGIGMFVSTSDVRVERTAFVENGSKGGGGGVYLWGARGEFRSCDFVRNDGTSDGGGAIYVHGGDATDPPPVRFTDCRFVGNDGVAFVGFGGNAELVNCSLVANDEASSIFGWPIAVVQGPGNLRLANCIVRDHAAPGTQPGMAGQFFSIVGGVTTIDDSCVEGWDGSLPGSDTFDADPLFTDADGADGASGTEDDDLSLSAGSPCLDRADHAWRALANDLDAAGLPRFVDQPFVVDQQTPCAPVADLGALERGPGGPWSDVGFGLASGLGPGGCVPHLAGAGALTPGSPTQLVLNDGPASAVGFLVLGLTPLSAPLLGGVLVPQPTFHFLLPTSASGGTAFAFPWPSVLGPGAEVFAQAWHLDATAPFGWRASNAQLGVAP